jgi:hypothetical protein
MGEPPDALVAFLDGIKLRVHVDVFMELCYDDVDDFVEYDAASLQRFRENLLDAGIGPGHVEKIVRAIDKLRVPSAAAALPPPIAGAPHAPSASQLPHLPPIDGGSPQLPFAIAQPLPSCARRVLLSRTFNREIAYLIKREIA